MYLKERAKWFAPKRYLGWGIVPITWQGWLSLIPLLAFLVVPRQILEEYGRSDLAVAWTIVATLLIVLDTYFLLKQIAKDRGEF